MNKNPLPALMLWFKRFKLMTISKFTLYFYEVLLQQSSSVEMKNVCNNYNIYFFTKYVYIYNNLIYLDKIIYNGIKNYLDNR